MAGETAEDAAGETAEDAAVEGATAEGAFNDYETFAAAYARTDETSSYRAFYERPAIVSMAGDVRGLRVLDAGCGGGALAARLGVLGAAVTGIDLSAGLLRIARERLGPDVPLHRGDLGQPLPFGAGSFDLVVSSLVMHYIADWAPPLREFRRVLSPGGRLVFSTHHPFTDLRVSGSDDYLGTFQFTEVWERDGRAMPMRFWHRPLRAMMAALRDAGFRVDEIAEPDPAPELAAADPKTYQYLSRGAQFLFFSAVRG
jgi:SAM-dependent methyltransferase